MFPLLRHHAKQPNKKNRHRGTRIPSIGTRQTGVASFMVAEVISDLGQFHEAGCAMEPRKTMPQSLESHFIDLGTFGITVYNLQKHLLNPKT